MFLYHSDTRVTPSRMTCTTLTEKALILSKLESSVSLRPNETTSNASGDSHQASINQISLDKLVVSERSVLSRCIYDILRYSSKTPNLD